MFRHVVLIEFVDDTTDEQKAAFRAALEALPAQIPEVLDCRVGPDAGLTDTNHDFAIVADFADADAYAAYRDHPAHDEFKATYLAPLAAGRVAVQYEH
jgi:hypothetical protein